MAVKTNYEIRSHSFSGRSSSAIPPAGGRTRSMSAIPAVGQNASYTSLRDLMPSAAFFSCYNRREPGLLDLKQLRMRDRLVEHAVRAYLHPQRQPRTRPRTSRSFCSFLKMITVPLQTTHNLLQAFFHEAGVWFRRMYVSI